MIICCGSAQDDLATQPHPTISGQRQPFNREHRRKLMCYFVSQQAHLPKKEEMVEHWHMCNPLLLAELAVVHDRLRR